MDKCGKYSAEKRYTNMGAFTKFQKIVLAGIGTFGGAMALYYSFDGNGKDVYASWTTNYSPSVQWDSNWDQ